MLYTTAVVFLMLWVLGMLTSATLGGFLHLFLVLAIFMLLANYFSGRKRLN